MRSPLISAAELHDVLGEVTLLDVRYRMGGPTGAEEFAKGHLPGASYVDLDLDLAGEGEGRHPLPAPADFEEAMRRAGVHDDRPVVVYDDWQGRAAARCWWLLRWAGHADVRVLDGGWTAWLAAGGVRTDVQDVQDVPGPGDFTARPGLLPVRLAPDVLGAGVLVDARAPERYRGEVEPVDPVAGHVPGAVNVPTEANLAPDGTFRPVDELRAAYDGVEGDVVVYCGSGVTACHDILALEQIGTSAALYPGSWSGWVSDPTRPVETG